MCLIIDTNVFGDFLANKSQDMQCIHDWLKAGKGKLSITNEGIYGKEFKPYSTREIMKVYDQKGLLKKCNVQEYHKAEKKFKNMKTHGIKIKGEKIRSDDLHVLALAEVGNVKILCTQDIALMSDFKRLTSGKIYKNKKKHGDMLLNTTCT